MDIRHLKSFTCTVELGSITRAAQELGLSQPALGFHIKHLEDELQTLLVVRGSRGVEPTPAGEMLFEKAKTILQEIDELKFSIRQQHGQPNGTVKLGLSDNILPALVTRVLRAVRSEFPDIRLNLSNAPGRIMQEWVRSGQLDLAILYYPNTPLSGLVAQPLDDEELIFVRRSDQAQSGAELVTLDEIFSCPLIMPGRPHWARMFMEETARNLGRELHVAYEVGSPPLVLNLIEEGMGSAVMLPGGLARQESPCLFVQRIAPPGLRFSRSLFYRETPRLSKAALAVKSLIKRLSLQQTA